MTVKISKAEAVDIYAALKAMANIVKEAASRCPENRDLCETKRRLRRLATHLQKQVGSGSISGNGEDDTSPRVDGG